MYYVTKYALTTGIIRLKESQAEISDSGYLYYRSSPLAVKTQVSPNDWYRDFREAEERALQLRARKVAALKKQIKKLTESKIEVKTL